MKNLVRPRLPQDLELEALIDVLKRHYQPKVVVIAELFKFFKRQQREGESIAVYLSELRRLAKDCEFGKYLQTALSEQLVCGLNSEALQRKVLAEADLTLERALQISQAFEAARQETRILRECAPQSPPTLKSETAYIVRKDTTGVTTCKPRNTEVVAKKHVTDAERKGIRHRIVELRHKRAIFARDRAY